MTATIWSIDAEHPQPRVVEKAVSVLASGAAIISGLAWRNVSRNSDLQIRLVKAGEMNSHLAQMNFAAAGLAHDGGPRAGVHLEGGPRRKGGVNPRQDAVAKGVPNIEGH